MLSVQNPQATQAIDTLQLLLQIITKPELFDKQIKELASTADAAKSELAALVEKEAAIAATEVRVSEEAASNSALKEKLEHVASVLEKEKLEFRQRCERQVADLTAWNTALSEKEQDIAKREATLNAQTTQLNTQLASVQAREQDAADLYKVAKGLQSEYEEKLSKLRSLV